MCAADIAEPTLAYWFKRCGFSSSIVEQRSDLSDEGYRIDFYGSGYDVAEKMGLLRSYLKDRYLNFLRGDLATALYEAVRASVPIQ